MKTENRKRNSEYRIFLCLVSLVFGLAFFGCDQKVQKTSQGLSETQLEAYKIISESLNSNEPLLRVNAIEVAAVTKQENYIPTIQKMLQDPFVPVRFAACVAIGDLAGGTEYKYVISSVNQLLKDNDPNVIIAASYAMAKLGYPEYLKVLRESVVNSQNQTIKANSAWLLGKSGDKGSIPLLNQIMKDPQASDKVSYGAAEALAMLGDNKIFEKIWAMLISSYADVKMLGINDMGTLGTSQAESALLTMLEDPIVEIRLAAAGQLGKMKNKSGQKVVLEVFQKNLNTNAEMERRIRISSLAALAIGEIGTANLTKFLPDLMKNESPYVRLAAAKAVLRSSHNL